MNSPSVDLYATFADELRARILSTPSSGYRARIYLLWALCGLKLLLAVSHMLLTWRDLRKRGKRLRLLRVQVLQNGSIVVFNSLFLYVLFSALGAVYFAIVRYKSYSMYFSTGTPHHLVMFNVQQWTPIFFSAFVFTAGNIAALNLVSRKAQGFETASRAWILAQNIGLAALVALYLALLLPVAFFANKKANGIYATGIEIMHMCERASAAVAAGQSTTPIFGDRTLASLLDTAVQLEEGEKQVRKYIDGALAIAVFFCLVFFIAAVASWRFVLQLRKQSQHLLGAHRHGSNPKSPAQQSAYASALQSIVVTREQRTEVDEADSYTVGLDLGLPAHPKRALVQKPSRAIPASARPFGKGSKSPLQPLAFMGASLLNASTRWAPADRQQSRDESESKESEGRIARIVRSNDCGPTGLSGSASAEATALKRLSRDLTLAVPGVLASCIVLPVLAFWGWLTPNDGRSWAARELQLEGFAYAELLISNIILAYFLYDILRWPTRYGQHGEAMEELRTLGDTKAPPGFSFRPRPVTGAVSLVLSPENGPRAQEVDRVYLQERSDISRAESMTKSMIKEIRPDGEQQAEDEQGRHEPQNW